MKIGHSRGPATGNEWGLAASVKVHPYGGKLMIENASGYLTIALSASAALKGWAKTPTSLKPGSTDAANGYFTAQATAGLDKVMLIDDLDARFIMPVTSGSETNVVEGIQGQSCDIVGVNDGTKQTASVGEVNATSVLVITALVYNAANEIDTSLIEVKINPAKRQAPVDIT